MTHESRMLKMLMPVLVAMLILTGCDGLLDSEGLKGFFPPKDDTDYYSEDVLGFALPEGASINDFDWFFHTGSYDGGSEAPLSDPYEVAGIWEAALWRKPDKKSDPQKEVYWINIEFTDKNGAGIPGINGMDPADAAELYAYDAFLDSDEAKTLGVTRSEASQKLIDALNAGDGSVSVEATMIQVGVEDADGAWREVNDARPIQYNGKYYPEAMFLKLKDKKGNELSANNFLTAADGQRATGACFPSNSNPILNGSFLLYRSGAGR